MNCAELVHRTFSIKYLPTDKVEFFLKQTVWDPHTFLRVQFWVSPLLFPFQHGFSSPCPLQDVSGHERYGQSTRMYYQDVLGVIVVLDVSKSSSLKEAVMWASDVQSKVTLGDTVKVPMILLANKGESGPSI
jgi:GTPase SAR1 family protein